MTYAATHNGGKGQVNLGFLQTEGDYPFINLFKGAQSWTNSTTGESPDPSTLSSDGYPISVAAGGVYTRFFIPNSLAKRNSYVLRWTGDGTVSLLVSCTVDLPLGAGVSNPSSNNFTSSSGSGRVLMHDVPESVLIGISTTGISDLIFMHEDHETLYDGGEIFNPDFKAALIEGNIGAIRFLNWSATNTSDVSTWASRKPLTYAYYAGQEYRANLFNTSSGTSSAFTVAAPSSWGGLVDKAQVLVRWHTGGSVGCTLNVGGTGAKPIYHLFCNPVVANTAPYVNKLSHLFYDALLDAWIMSGVGENALDNGVPPELGFRLCAEVGAHPWFNIPHYALTPMTDYTASLAAYCAANQPSWMRPTFEPANELWNVGGGFNQTWYAVAVGKAKGYGTDLGALQPWYGQALSTMGQDVASAYSVVKANVKTQTKYNVIGGVQTGYDLSVGGQQAERFESTLYKASTPQGATSWRPGGYAADAAKDWTTHIAPANYFTPAVYSGVGTDEEPYAAAYAGIRATVSISGTTMTVSTNAQPGANCTITNASPGVISGTNYFFPDEPIVFSAGGGTLPSQIVAGTTYYVSATGLSSTAFSVATAPGGSRINTSGGGSLSCTITNASPGVVFATNSFVAEQQVIFTAGSGTLPAELVAGTIYYVSPTGLSGSQFSVSNETPNGPRLATTGGSGTVLVQAPVVVQRTLAIVGKMQDNIYLQGVGAAGALIPEGTKIVSHTNATTWTLNKSLGTIGTIGVFGGLDMSAPDNFAETCAQAGNFSYPALLTLFARAKALALASGITKGMCYEGGYSPDITGAASTSVNTMRNASAYSGKVAKYNLLVAQAWFALTDGSFTAEFPSNFLFAGSVAMGDTGMIQTGSVWAVLQDVYQQPRPPQWVSMILVNKGIPTTITVNN